jgi:hypothetical protein
MGAGDWNLRLRGAHSNREVVALARDFIAQWTPAEIAEFPESCRPGTLKSADDLAYYAYVLAKEERRPAPCDPKLTIVATFFAAASLRMSEIAAVSAEPRIQVFLAEVGDASLKNSSR